jgi:hypothetical protein
MDDSKNKRSSTCSSVEIQVYVYVEMKRKNRKQNTAAKERKVRLPSNDYITRNSKPNRQTLLLLRAGARTEEKTM